MKKLYLLLLFLGFLVSCNKEDSELIGPPVPMNWLFTVVDSDGNDLLNRNNANTISIKFDTELPLFEQKSGTLRYSCKASLFSLLLKTIHQSISDDGKL